MLFRSPFAPPISLSFFNDTATTEIYTLSLHDALPILIEKMIKKTIGKKIISGEKIVSGGLLANLNDIVVDDINKPKFIYGISNGKGDLWDARQRDGSS